MKPGVEGRLDWRTGRLYLALLRAERRGYAADELTLMSMGRWTPTTPEVRWHLGALVKKGIVKHLGDGLYELNLAFSSL